MHPERPHAICGFRCHRWLRPVRRRWPLWLLLVGLLILVTTRLVEVRQLAGTLAQGHWHWIATVLLLQAGYYTLYAGLYQAGFATVGVQSSLLELIPVLFASILAGTVAPTGGLTAAAVLIEDAARREQSAARAAQGVLLVWAAGLAGVVPMLLAGLGYLRSVGALLAYQAIGALLFLLYVAALSGALFFALWQPGRLRHLLRWLQRRINALMARLRRPPLLPDDWARRNAAESTGAAMAIAKRPRLVMRTLALALLAHLVSLASLHAAFLAFDHRLGFGALAAGFSLGYAFSIISFIPFDLGLVEGVMVLVYTSVGVPAAEALLATLAFRGLNVWLPIALSFLAFRLWPRSSRQRGSR